MNSCCLIRLREEMRKSISNVNQREKLRSIRLIELEHQLLIFPDADDDK